MKKVVSEAWLFGIVLAFGLLAACGQSAPTWQEQYDLGVRYLSEGNYEEAIIAFTAAIEIDPKQASAYVGRGNAYIGLGETEEHFASAQTDYEQATELDETLAEAYLGLAEVYVRQGDYDRALEILERGLEQTGGNPDIADRIEEVREERPVSYNAYGAVEFTKRREYRDAGSFTDAELSIIRAAMALSASEDMQSLHQLAQHYEDMQGLYQLAEHHVEASRKFFSIFTILDGYKIYLWVWNLGEEGYSMEFEMRSENGTGHFAAVSLIDGEEQSNWGSCACKDWQWNGTMTETDTVHFRDTGTGPIETETGPVENNLKNGVFEGTRIYGGNTVTWKSVYQNGAEVEFDGIQREPDDSLWGAFHKYDKNSPETLEFLYW